MVPSFHHRESDDIDCAEPLLDGLQTVGTDQTADEFHVTPVASSGDPLRRVGLPKNFQGSRNAGQNPVTTHVHAVGLTTAPRDNAWRTTWELDTKDRDALTWCCVADVWQRWRCRGCHAGRAVRSRLGL